jgi:hypothetical protein
MKKEKEYVFYKIQQQFKTSSNLPLKQWTRKNNTMQNFCRSIYLMMILYGQNMS